MLQARSRIDDLEGLRISLGKKLLCKMSGTLEIDVLITTANDLDDLILMFCGKSLQAVINGNEADGQAGLGTEGKGNGGKSVLFNLKDATILCDLLNFLWLLLMMSLETSIEKNIDLANFRFPFPTRCNRSE